MHLVCDLIPDGDIVNKTDIVYDNQSTDKLTFNVSFPTKFDKKKSYPAIIIINGGCGPSLRLPANYIKQLTSWCKLLAHNNFISINFFWRYKFKNDIQNAITFIYKNAEKYNIDKTNLCTFSFSRGVSIGTSQILQLNKIPIKCMVAYYGELPKEIKSKNISSTLVVMAGKDKYFDETCNDECIKQIIDKNGDIEFLLYKTGEHFFDMLNDNAQTSKIINSTIDYLKKKTRLNT